MFLNKIFTMKNPMIPDLKDSSLENLTHMDQQAIELLKQLISTPSHSGKEEETAEIIGRYLSTHNISFQRCRNNIWALNAYFNSNKPTILLNSHHDTVKPNSGYTKDPYEPYIEDGKLYGLGSNDAGGPLVSLIQTFIYFYNRKDLPFNLCLAATAEEENAGDAGLGYVLPQLGKLTAAIVGEPTKMNMAIAEKGHMTLLCRTIGKSGHAARNEGTNAIMLAINKIEQLGNIHFIEDPNFKEKVRLTVTEIHAGIQSNVIPDSCSFILDVRLTTNYDPQEVIEILQQELLCEITILGNPMRASFMDVKHPLVASGISLGWAHYFSPTCSDRGWLKIPSLKLGPGDSARSHTADEYIEIAEIKAGIKGYIDLLDNLPLNWQINSNK